MSDTPDKPDAKPRHQPLKDRRAPRGRAGSVRWLKALLGRPLALDKRGQKLHVTLVERRRSPEIIQAESLARLREELRVRLLGQEHHHAATAMRHLVFVHDVLGRQGWPGVQAMGSRVLAKAQVQAQMLAQRESSRRLVQFVDRLRMLQAAAEAREERIDRSGGAVLEGHVPRSGGATDIEVSEISAEEYEATHRSWVATVSPALDGDTLSDPVLDTVREPVGNAS